ncbi:XtrA/YqaO family protein [Jeotgalibacillus terrae]|uniref:XtrA/YqaO family protein n=1 Tax=Jeotgalibacillus terrae TaxID=587735 RepID=A0ABW5ZLZ2_9BACL|nr:XtrA/YqaO family protein [Jeotgalibacillus terrae]MBM7581092.1 hypothetical protein [Jeotgalibacillus terrae]
MQTLNGNLKELLVDNLQELEHSVIVISGGKIKVKKLPSHGKFHVISHDNKVRHLQIETGYEF